MNYLHINEACENGKCEILTEEEKKLDYPEGLFPEYNMRFSK